MRYAIPIVNGKVAEHFGHCSHVAFFDVDEARNVITKKEIIASPGYEPGVLPVWLAEEGASVIIAKGMGSRAQGLFGENHIEVVTGTLEEDPEKIILDYMKGTLITGDNFCDH